ncbi:hypothetical protein C2W62_12720 [Candidatus Entotheonella serta]|nr:hypothetical protein C2W62_12720 [Candidatus Entotheonella serta]
MTKHYADDPEVVFIAVQTTFEGYGINTFEKAKTTMARYNLTIPTGQSGTEGTFSPLMRAYRTGGTPWTIIIDKSGVVRYNDYFIPPQRAISIIDVLKARTS